MTPTMELQIYLIKKLYKILEPDIDRQILINGILEQSISMNFTTIICLMV